MEIFNFKIFKDKSKFKITIPEKIIGIENDYYLDFSTKNLNFIINQIFECDGTVQRRLEKTGFIDWKIKFDNKNLYTNRFSHLMPYLFRPKSIENSLYSFQIEGRDWMLSEDNRILADDMGLGKTVQTISSVEILFFEEKIRDCIVFCPNNLSKTWEFEFKKWSYLLKVSILNTYDFKEFEFNNFFNKNNILICPYSLALKLYNLINLESYVSLLIADEAHKLRKSVSNVHKAVRLIKSKRKWLLTGTPLEKDKDDIKSILNIIKPKKSKTFSEVDDLILKSNLEAQSLRRIKKDVMSQLPKVIRKIEWLEMHDQQKLKYKDEIRLMRKSKFEDRIGFITKLSQLAAGGNDILSNKYERAKEIIDDNLANNNKVLVFSTYNNVLKTFGKLLNNNNIKYNLFYGEIDSIQRNKQLNLFKKSISHNILLANSKSASEGLTLTEASTVIFLNEWWNPSSNRQAEDRVNRIGQKKVVNIYVLRSINSIDENISQILERKVAIEKDFINHLVNMLN